MAVITFDTTDSRADTVADTDYLLVINASGEPNTPTAALLAAYIKAKFVLPDDVTAALAASGTDVAAGAPANLNTLDKLAAAINDDPDFHTTVSTGLATKLAANSARVASIDSLSINTQDHTIQLGWTDQAGADQHLEIDLTSLLSTAAEVAVWARPGNEEDFIKVKPGLETANADLASGESGIEITRGGGNNNPQIAYDRAEDEIRFKYPGAGASFIDIQAKKVTAATAHVTGQARFDGSVDLRQGFSNLFFTINTAGHEGSTYIKFRQSTHDADDNYFGYNHTASKFEFWRHAGAGFSDIRAQDADVRDLAASRNVTITGNLTVGGDVTGIPTGARFCRFLHDVPDGVTAPTWPSAMTNLSALYTHSSDISADPDVTAAAFDAGYTDVADTPARAEGITWWSRTFSRRSPGASRKIAFNNTPYATSESGSDVIPGLLIESSQARGNVDGHAGEVVYPFRYAQNESGLFVNFGPGQGSYNLRPTLWSGTTFTLAPGTWRVRVHVRTNRAPSATAEGSFLGLMVEDANGDDQVQAVGIQGPLGNYRSIQETQANTFSYTGYLSSVMDTGIFTIGGTNRYYVLADFDVAPAHNSTAGSYSDTGADTMAIGASLEVWRLD